MNSQVQQNQMTIRTRFAPSPTGFLHIGGARTALFNWLFAKHHGGEFLLRIEDTDRKRSTQEAIDAIGEGLSWLGLDWTGEAISQFAQAERHVEVANALVERGKAFRCYCTPEEVQELRDQAFADGRALRSPWRDRDAGADQADKPFTVRFRASDNDTVIEDEVQGTVKWAAKEFDDLILLRSDGTPTYNLAVVVDDHDMGITHIVRGDDHLVNAARQGQIYDAMGWDRPVFAHIPLIHGDDGKKLSKRHGALGAQDYRDMGYLPEGLRNYLLRLGWAHGDQELFSDAEAIAAFDLGGLNKAPARMDLSKLAHINSHHIAHADDARLLELSWSWISGLENRITEEDTIKARYLRAMPVLKTRASTLDELAQQGYFLIKSRPFEFSGKAAKALKDDARERLNRLFITLSDITDWTEGVLSQALQEFADAEEVGFGKVGQPLRAALTGGAPAPDLAQVMVFLGRDEALDRITDQMSQGS